MFLIDVCMCRMFLIETCACAQCFWLWRPCVVRVWCVGRISGLQKLSRGFLRLVALLPTLPPPGSLYSGLPQSSPSSSTPYSFPYYKSVLPQRFGSTVGAVISLFLPVGGLYCSQYVCLYVYLLPLPLVLPTPPQQEPRVLVSADTLWSAWTVTSIRTARIFIGVDSFIGNDS